MYSDSVENIYMYLSGFDFHKGFTGFKGTINTNSRRHASFNKKIYTFWTIITCYFRNIHVAVAEHIQAFTRKYLFALSTTIYVCI